MSNTGGAIRKRRVPKLTYEKPYGVQESRMSWGWNSIHGTRLAAVRATDRLAKRLRRRVDVYRSVPGEIIVRHVYSAVPMLKGVDRA